MNSSAALLDRLALPLRRLLTPAGVISALMAAFHGWLLARRLVDGTLFEAAVIGRWLASLALVAGCVWLHRRGVSLLRGRRALAMWTIVLLLHIALPAPAVTVAGEVLRELPLAAIGLIAVPVAIVAQLWHGLAAHLGVVGRLPTPRPVRAARQLTPLPIAVRAYPPIRRRPPPF